ncbi:MAG: GFA family protein [Woeseiaceae bacterium]
MSSRCSTILCASRLQSAFRKVPPRYTGSCLCGGVQFEITAELSPIDVCYCQMCRKATGGPLATNAAVSTTAFHVIAGAELIAGYESSPGEKRHFCSRCGSPIYSERQDRPQVVRVRVGTINEPLNVRPAVSYHTASKCNWWELADNLPRFESE